MRIKRVVKELEHGESIIFPFSETKGTLKVSSLVEGRYLGVHYHNSQPTVVEFNNVFEVEQYFDDINENEKYIANMRRIFSDDSENSFPEMDEYVLDIHRQISELGFGETMSYENDCDVIRLTNGYAVLVGDGSDDYACFEFDNPTMAALLVNSFFVVDAEMELA